MGANLVSTPVEVRGIVFNTILNVIKKPEDWGLDDEFNSFKNVANFEIQKDTKISDLEFDEYDLFEIITAIENKRGLNFDSYPAESEVGDGKKYETIEDLIDFLYPEFDRLNQ